MFLRNYDNMLTQLAMPYSVRLAAAGQAEGWGDSDDENIRLLKYNGARYTIPESATDNLHPLHNFSAGSPVMGKYSFSNYTYFIVGNGRTAEEQVSYNDHKLTSPFSDSKVGYSGSIEYSEPVYDAASNTWTYEVSLLGTAKTTIEIGEIGLEKFGVVFYKEFFEEKIPVPKDANFRMTLSVKLYAHSNKPAEVPKVTVEVE